MEHAAKPHKPIVTICSSAAFYKQAIDIQEQLQKKGLEVIVPITATRMKESGDYDVSHYKTWFANEGDYPEKAKRMRTHFDEITKADAILVLNYEKHGQANYIGGNVLMEMSLAFYQQKPIFVINDLPEYSPFLEELKGMMPTILHGKITDIPTQLKAA
ncbi:MAG TPA: hypothetical protein VMY99_00420 [Nevskiaceae bacterium]|nr:hypothetical protein [Nevskiaceae bacterium]